MIDSTDRVEMEDAERRRSDIIYNGFWKYWLGFAIVSSILDLYVAVYLFYFRSPSDVRLLHLFASCMIVLIPWLGIGGLYRRSRTRILASNSPELWPMFRYSCVSALSYTYLALSLVLGMCRNVH